MFRLTDYHSRDSGFLIQGEGIGHSNIQCLTDKGYNVSTYRYSMYNKYYTGIVIEEDRDRKPATSSLYKDCKQCEVYSDVGYLSTSLSHGAVYRTERVFWYDQLPKDG